MQQLTHRLENHDMIGVDSTVGVDSVILKFIKPYTDSIKGVMNEIIGYNPKPMIAQKPESPLSNFVTDLVFEAGKKYLKNQNIKEGEILCVINVKGLRAPLSQGEITTRHIFEIMPFENKLVVVKMDANNLMMLFDHIAKSNGDGLAGASFSITNDKAINVLVNGQPIEDKKTYWVITSDYLADGGDGYSVFKSSDVHLVSDEKVRELIVAHIENLTKQNLVVDYNETPRITVLNEN
jgi:2',3'-cyclic-nucleotide 2'-phosphodiesterase (5'-nucleotidase family)